jgi:nitrogen fixation/metabolism regulation signal transduction histidine kinase
MTEADVVALMREAIEAYRPLFDRLDFSVENQLPASPVFVSMDRDAIAQALLNPFQNARPDRTSVRTRSSRRRTRRP